MATHVHPTSSPRLAVSGRRPQRHWSALHWSVTAVLAIALSALVVLWSRVVPTLVAEWSALTPFETPIAWFVMAVLSGLTLAVGCATAAAVLWR